LEQRMKTALSTPVDVRVLQRRDNGSGVVEIPLLPATEIDLAHTAGGGKGKVKITEADLLEIVANFARYPGPVPIGAPPHVDGEGREGYSPGFVNAVVVRDGVLYGELDLTPGLFIEVDSGGWRGFSVEIVKNLKTATVELTGWVLTGGILTNRPATDTHFRIAASGESKSEERACIHVCLTAGDHRRKEMAEEKDQKIAALEAELATEKETVKTLRANRETDKSDTVTLEARLTEANKDLAAVRIELSQSKATAAAAQNEVERLNKALAKETEARKGFEVKLEAETARSTKEKVEELARSAIDRGVSAVLFEGLDEDPVKWFSARFASIEAMEQLVKTLPTVTESGVKSGNKPDGTPAPVDPEIAARLERLGLNPKFVGVKSENEILALRAANKKE